MKQYVCLSAERINAGKLNLVTVLNRKTMKKNILKVAFVVAIAMVTGIQVFNAQKTETLSDVTKANVEALAIEKPSTGGTGPGEMITCADGKSSRKECMGRNPYDCTPSSCK